jgi:hypothetical protein
VDRRVIAVPRSQETTSPPRTTIGGVFL